MFMYWFNVVFAHGTGTGNVYIVMSTGTLETRN